MIVAEIDRDYLTKDLEMPTRVGHKFEVTHWRKCAWPKVRWRCKDDDGEICYGGWLLNDSGGEVQIEVLRYCMHDAGCTTIEVKYQPTETDPVPEARWIQEIG